MYRRNRKNFIVWSREEETCVGVCVCVLKGGRAAMETDEEAGLL